MDFKSGVVELRGVFAVSLPLDFTGKKKIYINSAIGVGDRRFYWFCYFAQAHEWSVVKKELSPQMQLSFQLAVISSLEGVQMWIRDVECEEWDTVGGEIPSKLPACRC